MDPSRQTSQETNSTFCSVVNLPTEILCAIFTELLPKYPLCPPLTGNLSPAVLTHVCRRWREVAVADPSLWRAIAVLFDDYRIDQEPFDIVHLVDIWLKRSGQYPLSLHLTGQGNSDWATRQFPHVLALAVSHSSRWEHVELNIPRRALRTVVGPFPLLRHLDVGLTGPDLSMSGMPLLRTVILDLDYPVTSLIALPWAQLTSLMLNNATAGECVSILQATPDLVHCTVCDVAPSRFEDLQHVTLLSLQSLTLDSGWVSTLPDLLAVLVVPALHILQIRDYCLGENPPETLALFITTSGCRLEELRVTGKPSAERQEVHCRAFPSIPKILFF
ncbi:hypothetical protein C8R46DRAFT_276105 [Mycena filopes]|nr:hypothetical protein C8R46DRAFT_276105 [Mycena filopes]